MGALIPQFIPGLFDIPPIRNHVNSMKVTRKTFLWLVTATFVTGSGLAQDNSALVQGMQTNAATAFLLVKKTEPQFILGSRTVASGLVVDFMEPVQTWNLFNPAFPAPVKPKPEPSTPPVIVPPPPISAPEFHGPNFAFLRISFP